MTKLNLYKKRPAYFHKLAQASLAKNGLFLTHQKTWY